MFKKFLMGLVCLTLVAMVGCGGGGGSSHTPTQDMKEALKGMWFLHSRDDLNFYTSNNGNVTYIEIKDENKFLRVNYDWDENLVYEDIPNKYPGTWVYDDSKLYVTYDGYGVTTFTVNLQNDTLTLSYEAQSANMRLSANTVIEVFKKTKPAKYQAPAISEEALKGKWYAYSIIEGDNPEAYYYSSNDGKAAYIDIKDNKKYEIVNYNCESEVNKVFTGAPTNEEGTWRLEDNLLIFTTDHDMGYTVISVDDETLTLSLQFNNGFTDILKFKKNTPPAKLE